MPKLISCKIWMVEKLSKFSYCVSNAEDWEHDGVSKYSIFLNSQNQFLAIKNAELVTHLWCKVSYIQQVPDENKREKQSNILCVSVQCHKKAKSHDCLRTKLKIVKAQIKTWFSFFFLNPTCIRMIFFSFFGSIILNLVSGVKVRKKITIIYGLITYHCM